MAYEPWKKFKLPVIVKNHGKYQDNHFIANDVNDMALIFYEIFSMNEENEYYNPAYMHEDERKNYRLIRDCDALEDIGFEPLWSFIMGRADYEYEKVEIVVPDTF